MHICYDMEIKQSEEFFYRVTKNNEAIFENLNSCEENVFRNNKNIAFYDGEWIRVKKNNFIIHHVKPMETIEKISSQYFVSVEKIINDNNLNSNKLFIGQELKIFK